LPVWLYLHSPGTLKPGFPPPLAQAAFSGAITAINYTEFHPETQGIPAAWGGAEYVIEEDSGVFHLRGPIPHTKPPTQIIFRADKKEDVNTIWVSESPQPDLERIAGDEWTSKLDSGFRRFFTRASSRGPDLIHRPYQRLRRSLRLSRQEVGQLDASALATRLELPQGTEILLGDSRPRRGRSAFIYRGKYRT
jgi:hypothetical protein